MFFEVLKHKKKILILLFIYVNNLSKFIYITITLYNKKINIYG